MKLETLKSTGKWELKLIPSIGDLLFTLLVVSPGIIMFMRLISSSYYYTSYEEWMWTVLTLFVFSFLGSGLYPDGAHVILNETDVIVRFVKTNKLDQWDGKIKKEFSAKISQVRDIVVETEYDHNMELGIPEDDVNPDMGEFEKNYREKKRLKSDNEQKRRWRILMTFEGYKIPLMEGFLVGDVWKTRLDGIKEEMLSNLNNFKTGKNI